MRRRIWQPVACAKLHNKRQANWSGIGQPHDAQTTHLQQPRQHLGGSRPSGFDDDLVIGDKDKTLGQQAQQQVGFPRTRWSQEQHAMPIPGGTACVKVHKTGYVARFCSKWKHIVMLVQVTRSGSCFTWNTRVASG